MESYRAFLRTLVELDLHTQITPIQLAIRLLIPEGSLLLELPEIRKLVGLFDARALYYPWHNPDPALDALVRQDSGDDQAGRKAAHAACGDLPADLGSGGDWRVSGYCRWRRGRRSRI